ncbi:MAG: signal peptidase I [Microthrixaceae bacterium]
MTAAIAPELANPRQVGARPRRGRVRRAVSWIATALVLVVWFVALRPVSLGGPLSFIGVTGISMEPTYYEGDLVVVRERSHYGVGDIVAYRIPAGDPGEGHNIIHRIISGDGTTGFTTQGDNNSYTDVWHPTERDVIGEVWIEAPNVARWLGRLRSPTSLAVLVGGGSFLVMIVPERRRRRAVASSASEGSQPGGPVR